MIYHQILEGFAFDSLTVSRAVFEAGHLSSNIQSRRGRKFLTTRSTPLLLGMIWFYIFLFSTNWLPDVKNSGDCIAHLTLVCIENWELRNASWPIGQKCRLCQHCTFAALIPSILQDFSCSFADGFAYPFHDNVPTILYPLSGSSPMALVRCHCCWASSIPSCVVWRRSPRDCSWMRIESLAEGKAQAVSSSKSEGSSPDTKRNAQAEDCVNSMISKYLQSLVQYPLSNQCQNMSKHISSNIVHGWSMMFWSRGLTPSRQIQRYTWRVESDVLIYNLWGFTDDKSLQPVPAPFVSNLGNQYNSGWIHKMLTV